MCFGLKAQSTFQTIIEKDPDSSSGIGTGSLTESTDGNIYAVFGSWPVGINAKNRLVKISPTGTILWDTTYAFTGQGEYRPEIIPTYDSNVLLASDSYSYPLDDEDSLQDILLWKINGQGEIIWQKVLSARNFWDMSLCNDKGYLITGAVHEKANYWGMDIIVYKLDSLGNTLWEKRLGLPSSDGWLDWENPISIRELDNKIYVCGSRADVLISKLDGVLYALDEQGNLDWDITLVSSSANGEDLRINSVFKFNNKHYFNVSSAGSDAGLFEFLPETGEYWEVPDSANFRAIGTFTTGYNFEVDCLEQNISTVSIKGTSYYLEFFDNLMEPYYTKELNNVQGSLMEYITTSDGGRLMMTVNSGPQVELTKTDCLGNDYWSNACNSKISEGSLIALYPNPVENLLTIEVEFDIIEIEVYDMAGRKTTYKNVCYLCHEHELDISTLATGVYRIVVKGTTDIAVSGFVKI